MEIATARGVTINGIKLAGWAEAEYLRKSRAEWDHRFFGNVRGTFVLLLIATILVFIHNHEVEIQCYSSAKLGKLEKSSTVESLRQNALKHEHEADQAGQ